MNYSNSNSNTKYISYSSSAPYSSSSSNPYSNYSSKSQSSNSHSLHSSHSFFPMFFAMLLGGLLSTMNIWVDKISDIRFSLNDLYMTFLMIGWMFFFLGIYYNIRYQIVFGFLCIIISIYCIRTQFKISTKEYIRGMIPHHSMAILMSKELLDKGEEIDPKMKEFVENIANVQRKEITIMKKMN